MAINLILKAAIYQIFIEYFKLISYSIDGTNIGLLAGLLVIPIRF
jgi:hypothetical protein